MTFSEKIETVATAFDEADSVVVFAGSGLSAESGVPTFRGEDGLYSDDKVASYTRVRTLRHKPSEVLNWYQKRREMVSQVAPNEGHHALARLSRHVDRFDVATQNVDDLLERAWSKQGGRGTIRHLHGEIKKVYCDDCGGRPSDTDLDLSTLPECHQCGGMLRPGVVMFGEALPTGAFEESRDAAAGCDLCLIVGTSGLVYPAAHIPEIAARGGAFLVEINPNESGVSDSCDVCLRAKTGEALPLIEGAISSDSTR